MPLPSVLAAKLAKRGLYAPPIPKPPEKEHKRDYRGVISCLNKSNIYHDCTHWCEAHWKPVAVPEAKYMRNIGKLIQKYPLPHNWTEIFDKGLKRYYFWEMEKDMVSWLPPKHPKAVCTESAAKLREKRIKGIEERIMYKADNESRPERKRDRKESSTSRRDYRDRYESDRRHRSDDYRRRSRRDYIDPMDPASYSDIPYGGWSDGLEPSKSAVDSTTSGASYQQRPYPSPGDVLHSNRSRTRR